MGLDVYPARLSQNRYSGKGTIKRSPRLRIPPFEIGPGSLAGTLPVIHRGWQPTGVAVHLVCGQGAVWIVGEFAIRFGKAPFVPVAEHGPVRQPAAPGESTQ